MRRMPELDGLRGLAALGIAIFHLRPQDFPFGCPKVDLFFALSGYLITTIVLRHGAVEGFLRTFFVRRVLRTWPLYFATLALVVAMNPYLPRPTRLDALPYFLTFTQNAPRYWSNTVPPFNLYFLHTWSLAVEQQFYILWPVLVLLAGRRRLPWVCLGLLLMSVGARAVGFHPCLLLARCDGFALGGLLAALLSDPAVSPARRVACARVSLAGLVVGSVFLLAGMAAFGIDAFTRPDPVWPSLSMLATALVFGGVVGLTITHSGHPILAPLRGRAAAALATISYGLYVLHPLAFAATALIYRQFAPGEPRWLDPIKLVACLLAATFSYLFLERPIASFKDRFAYGPPRPRTLDSAIPGRRDSPASSPWRGIPHLGRSRVQAS